MKTRIKSKTLLAFGIAFATLAVTWAMWGARPAKAIVVIGGKTGMFNLAQGEAVRINVANTSGEVAIIDDGDVVDSQGQKVFDFSEFRLDAGQATSFEFIPRIADGQHLALRVELMIEGDSVKDGKVPTTIEVFDTATGKTSFLLGQDFIIDDGK